MRKKEWIMSITLLAGFLICSNDVFAEARPRYISISSMDAESAWTRQKGTSYHQLTYSHHTSKYKYTTVETDGMGASEIGDVQRVKTDKFTANTITYSGEYGVTDSLTVFIRIPYINTDYEEVSSLGDDGPDGIGDIDIGFRYNIFHNLFNSQVMTSVQGTVKIPEAYDINNPFRYVNLGDGQYDTKLEILFGREWTRGYAILNTGYKYRFENNTLGSGAFKPSDEINARIGGGYDLTSNLKIRGSLDWIRSIGNATISDELFTNTGMNYGGFDVGTDKEVLIKDSLGLEQNIMNLGISMAYAITEKFQAILFYNTDVKGVGVFETKDAAEVSTYSLAAVLVF